MKAEERAKQAISEVLDGPILGGMKTSEIIAKHILAAEREAERATIEQITGRMVEARLNGDVSSMLAATILGIDVSAFDAAAGRRAAEEEISRQAMNDAAIEAIRALPSAYGEEGA